MRGFVVLRLTLMKWQVVFIAQRGPAPRFWQMQRIGQVLATFGKFEPSTPINVDCSTFNLSTGLGLGPSFASKSDCHLPNYLVGMYECGPVYIRLLFRQPAT